MSRRNLGGPLVCQVDARPTTVVKAFVVSMMLTEFSSASYGAIELAGFPLSAFGFIFTFTTFHV